MFFIELTTGPAVELFGPFASYDEAKAKARPLANWRQYNKFGPMNKEVTRFRVVKTQPVPVLV